MGMVELVRYPAASPSQLSGFLGHLTWLGLLNRPSLSAFSEIYSITRGGGDGTCSGYSGSCAS